MNKNERFLNNLNKANNELEKALKIVDNCYNQKYYLLNKNYTTYCINKIITIQQQIKNLKNGFFIEQEEK